MEEAFSKSDRSRWIIGYVTFIGDSSRGLLFPALWPLCQQLGGNRMLLGYLVATFSVGRLMISNYFGNLTDKYRHRLVLLIAAILMLIGGSVWALSGLVSSIAMLFVGQLVLGCGTGTLGVTRSYVAERSSPEKRTYLLAQLSALQYAGFAVTPLLGSSLVVSGGMVSTFMEFSLPAFLVLSLIIISLFLLYFVFEDYEKVNINIPISETLLNPMLNESDEENKTVNYDDDDDSNNLNKNSKFELIDIERKPEHIIEEEGIKDSRHYMFFVMILLNFATKGGIAVYETLGSALLLDTYGVSQFGLGGIVSGAGIIGTIQLLYFKEIWGQHFSNYHIMVFGILIIIVAQALVLHWTDDRNAPLWRFILSFYMVYGFGYPLANSAVLGVFSSLQKSGKQAKAQALFAFSGSAARIIFPVIAGYLDDYVEEASSFCVVMILMAMSLIGVMVLEEQILSYCSGLIGQSYSETLDTKSGFIGLRQRSVIVISLFLIVASIGAINDWGVKGW